jgi:hypothetical protein
VCSTTNAPSTKACSVLFSGSGKCSNGTCMVCEPTCGTNPSTCGTGQDGCGGTCACKMGKQCFSGVCQLPVWAICQTNTISSSECGGTNSAGYSCAGFGTGSNYFCVPRPNGSSCPSGTTNYLGYCVVACTPPPQGSCGSPFGRCEPNPAPDISDLAGICIR